MYWAKVDDVILALSIGAWLWRIDIRDYYRNIEVDPADWPLLAFRSRLTPGGLPIELWDTRMEFGGRNCVEIAHRMTCGSLAAIESAGVRNATAILDDFLGAERTEALARVAFKIACGTLQTLGYPLKWGPGKTEPPSQLVKWNGFGWDTKKGTVFVSADKAAAITALIYEALETGSARHKRSLTSRAFQHVRGLITWAATAVWGGRTFTSGLFSQALPRNDDFVIRLCRDAELDLPMVG